MNNTVKPTPEQIRRVASVFNTVLTVTSKAPGSLAPSRDNANALDALLVTMHPKFSQLHENLEAVRPEVEAWFQDYLAQDEQGNQKRLCFLVGVLDQIGKYARLLSDGDRLQELVNEAGDTRAKR